MSGVSFVIGAAEEEGADSTEALENVLKGDKDGHKLFGKSDFSKIKKQIAGLKNIHDSEDKKQALVALIALSNKWLGKHSKDKKPDDLKRVEHVREIVPKLETMLEHLNKELSHVGDGSDREYFMGLYKEISVEYKHYQKDKGKLPHEEQLEILYSIKEDCDEWLKKHIATDLTAKEEKQKLTITTIKQNVEKRVALVSIQQELSKEIKKWKQLEVAKAGLDAIANKVDRLVAISDLEHKMSALKTKLS